GPAASAEPGIADFDVAIPALRIVAAFVDADVVFAQCFGDLVRDAEAACEDFGRLNCAEHRTGIARAEAHAGEFSGEYLHLLASARRQRMFFATVGEDVENVRFALTVTDEVDEHRCIIQKTWPLKRSRRCQGRSVFSMS